MRGSDHPESKDTAFAPFVGLSQTYFAGMDRFAKAYAPAFKSVSRYNLEVARLTAQRGQAWLEAPARLGRCTNPQELFGEQVRFWQTATAQYMEGWQRMMAAAVPFSAIPGLNGAMAPTAHDFITMPEASETAKQRTDRRAA